MVATGGGATGGGEEMGMDPQTPRQLGIGMVNALGRIARDSSDSRSKDAAELLLYVGLGQGHSAKAMALMDRFAVSFTHDEWDFIASFIH